VGTLTDVVSLLYDVEVESLAGAAITPDETFAQLKAVLEGGDVDAAMALLGAEISRLQAFRRVLASGAAGTERREPDRGLDLSLYLSDLHSQRARLRMAAGDIAGSRDDLLAARMLPRPHPDAAPLLVEAYERIGQLGYAMSLLSRIHRDDPPSLAKGLHRLILVARFSGAEATMIELGIDLLAQASKNGLYTGIVDEHRRWRGPPPQPGTLGDLRDEVISAMSTQDITTAKAKLESLLAWAPEFAAGWWLLGRMPIESELAQPPQSGSTDGLVVTGPDDPTTLHASAEAFELAVHFDSSQHHYWADLAGTKLALGDNRGALRAAEYAVHLRPEAETIWFKALALIRIGDPEGLNLLSHIVRLSPTSDIAARAQMILDVGVGHDD
jgi:tetratricopeptide (TPR) repeat protein